MVKYVYPDIMQTTQSGNVLFLILIAVALFAALSYAVTETSRGGGMDISDKRAAVVADEILIYMSSVEKVVQRALSRGISEGDLCFDYDEYPGAIADYEHAACADPVNRIFGSAGGGVKWQEPTSEALTGTGSGLWVFDGSNRVVEIGTDNAVASSADLVMFLFHVSDRVCRKINERAGVTAADAAPPRDDVTVTTTPYIGTFTDNSRISDTPGVLNRKQTACFEGGGTPAGGTYHIYHVLHAR